jgi:hypothetical protein
VAAGLLTGPEGQRVGELHGDAPREPAYIIDSADMAAASEICHIEGIVRSEAGDAEAGGYVLAGTGTIIVGKTGEGRSCT